MKNELNIDNLRTFVNALNKLPSEVKNNAVDMGSTEEPVCGTVGCHAGLISIVADYMPELKSLYPQGYEYDYFMWANTLAEFLGFTSSLSLGEWGRCNPKLWGNIYGFNLFVSGAAFEQETDVFDHSVIIERWSAVLKRVEQLNKKGESNGK